MCLTFGHEKPNSFFCSAGIEVWSCSCQQDYMYLHPLNALGGFWVREKSGEPVRAAPARPMNELRIRIWPLDTIACTWCCDVSVKICPLAGQDIASPLLVGSIWRQLHMHECYGVNSKFSSRCLLSATASRGVQILLLNMCPPVNVGTWGSMSNIRYRSP